jgi:hypothetical protein
MPRPEKKEPSGWRARIIRFKTVILLIFASTSEKGVRCPSFALRATVGRQVSEKEAEVSNNIHGRR